MNTRLTRSFFYIAMLALSATLLSSAQAQAATLRFVAEFSATDSNQAPSTLDVTFYDFHPNAGQAEDVLRKCLEASIAAHPVNDITASAWFSASTDDSTKQPIELASGSNTLLYNAKDKAIHAGHSTEKLGESDSAQEDDPLAAIAGADKVMESCKDVKPQRLATLVGVGAKERGSERKFIVKAMRTWCKDNDVALDRKMRSCMSAISKAIISAGSAAGMNPADLAAAVARGADAYNVGQCGNCHSSNGRGSAKGPDLTDSKWLHCDGSMAGIRRVLVSGVPQNKLKDSSRPFGMNPATNLIPDQKQLTDLAAYVQNLSKK